MMLTMAHQHIGSALLFLLAKSTAAANDAPTTSIATIWSPNQLLHPYILYPSNYKINSYASIVAVDATATTYTLDCATAGWTPDRYHCDGFDTVSMTVGPSIAEITGIVSIPFISGSTGRRTVDQTDAVNCVLLPSAATCEYFLDSDLSPELQRAPNGWTPLEPITGTDFEGYYWTFTITGGLEKLSMARTTSTSSVTVEVPVETGSPRETGSGTSSGSGVPVESGKSSGADLVVLGGMGGVVVGISVLLGGWLV